MACACLATIAVSPAEGVAGEMSLDAATSNSAVSTNSFNIDRLWVIVAAAFVFLMQAGFKSFEVGVAREKNATAIGMKNVIDWIIGSLVFFAIGFGLMFGHSKGGFIGTDLFFIDGIDGSGGESFGHGVLHVPTGVRRHGTDHRLRSDVRAHGIRILSCRFLHHGVGDLPRDGTLGLGGGVF